MHETWFILPPGHLLVEACPFRCFSLLRQGTRFLLNGPAIVPIEAGSQRYSVVYTHIGVQQNLTFPSITDIL